MATPPFAVKTTIKIKELIAFPLIHDLSEEVSLAIALENEPAVTGQSAH